MDNAVRGARNPMSSWEKSDSYVDGKGSFVLGENDRNLTRRLCRAGSDHRKFIRQIFVSVDITAPLYWGKEFDTYKVATVANSTSTMHRLHAKPLTLEDFSTDRMSPQTLERFGEVVDFLVASPEVYRNEGEGRMGRADSVPAILLSAAPYSYAEL